MKFYKTTFVLISVLIVLWGKKHFIYALNITA